MAKCIREFPDIFPDLATLANKSDIEADFYANVVHVQVRRRERAIRKLYEKCSSSTFNNVSVCSIS